jgi:hypothetical protein
MYEHRQHRVVVKKRKSAVNANSKKKVKTIDPSTYDEVLPLKIHSPLEERGSLRKSVNYRKQGHNTITTQREITYYDVEKEANDPRFWTFFHIDWYHSMY